MLSTVAFHHRHNNGSGGEVHGGQSGTSTIWELLLENQRPIAETEN
jgi:hypothetical protein